jgi:S1-C subfamily serine protease
VPVGEVDLVSLYADDPDYGRYGSYLGRIVKRIIRSDGLTGMFVQSAADNSPVFKKVFAGDMVTKVNGVRIRSLRGLCGVIQSTAPGERITISGVRITSGTTLGEVLDPWTVRVKTRR